MKQKRYFVYSLTNVKNIVLYTWVTDDLRRRLLEHGSGRGSVFTKKYKVSKLVYYEVGNDINTAISREKIIKGASRQKEIDLFNRSNPEWNDLYEKYFF